MADCERCWSYRPRRIGDEVAPCGLYQRAPEGECPDFLPGQPVELCRESVHSTWDSADRPRCRNPQGARERTDASCPGFEPRPPARPLPCPACGAPLGAVDGAAVCPQGHRWPLHRGKRNVCPRCGGPYGTFGIDDPNWNGQYRDVYSLCPECGWSRVRTRYTGPARGRGYGGQRWSPRTGRLPIRGR